MKNPVIYRVINKSNNVVEQFRRAVDVAHKVVQNPHSYLIIKSQAEQHQLIADIAQELTVKELTLWLDHAIIHSH